MTTFRTLLFFIILLAVTLPSLVVALEPSQYQPLATGIPGVTDKAGTPTLVQYLNAIFTLTISIAALIAVVRIVIAGFQYMMTDAWGSKEEATSTIKAVVVGLVVLLLSTLILKTINPDLLNLNILQLSAQPAHTTSTQVPVAGSTGGGTSGGGLGSSGGGGF